MRLEERELAQALIAFFMSFPIPSAYKEIMEEQIRDNPFSTERYSDCFKILFVKKTGVRKLPVWLPTLLQGCQILKDDGPISCQLFVEDGYVVQFEVVDMGLNEIDWDYFWSHKAIFDIEYDLKVIKHHLESGAISIVKSCVFDSYILLEIHINGLQYQLHLYDCTICAFPATPTTLECRSHLDSKQRYAIVSVDGNLNIICSLVCLQNNLYIGLG